MIVTTCKKHGKLEKEEAYIIHKSSGKIKRRCRKCSLYNNKISYLNNKEKRLKQTKDYRIKNKEKAKITRREYAKKNIEHRRYKHKIARDQLKDFYIRDLLIRKLGWSSQIEIPKEIIELKRNLLLIKRKVKSLKEEAQ